MMDRAGIVFLASMLLGCSEGGVPEPAEAKAELAQTTAEPLDFALASSSDIGYRGMRRMVWRVVADVEAVPEEGPVRATMEAVWRPRRSQCEECTVFLYLPGMETDGVAYAVAEYVGERLTEFKVQPFALMGTQWDLGGPQTAAGNVEPARLEPEPVAEGAVRPGPRTYRLELSVRETSPRTLDVAVNTDFPDRTRLLVTVNRDYYEAGGSELYAGEIYSRDHAVRNGRIEVTVPVDDARWTANRERVARMLQGAGEPYRRMERISPSVEVSVMFSPRRDQPNEVLKVLGTEGEHLRGAAVSRGGNFQTMEVRRDISIPYRP